MSISSRASLVKLAGVGTIAAAALAAAPMSLAATTGGVGLIASAAQIKSAPFTLGVSARTVKPGQKITISGLAYARAGKNLTIMSRAISSSRTVAGMPAVQTPALVEGIYYTTVRVSPATDPGVYPVILRFGNRQVASINDLRVIAAGSRSGKPARLSACDGISFAVLNNDRAGSAFMPAGRYSVSSANMDCGSASAEFTSVLAGAGRQIPGWGTASTGAGRATFTQRNSGLSFSVALAATAKPKQAAFKYVVPVKPAMLAKGSTVTVSGTVTSPQANVKNWWSASTINSTVQKGVNNAFQMPYSANGYRCTPTINGEHTSFVCSLQGADVPTKVTFRYSVVYRGDTASG